MTDKNNIDTTLAVLKNNIEHLREIISSGFEGTHKRQDIANGRLGKNEKKVIHIEAEMENIQENFATKTDLLSLQNNQVKKESNTLSYMLNIFITISSSVITAFLILKILNT